MKTFMRLTVLVMVVISFSLISQRHVLAWGPLKKGDPTAHTDITSFAIKSSIVNENGGDYLKKMLDLTDGVNARLMWNLKEHSVVEWLKDEGAPLEDGYCRELNHFLNPLTNAGLIGEAAPFWAQSSSSQTSWQPTSQVCGLLGRYDVPDASNLYDWSWPTTRGYFYFALTSATDADRQANFAKMFRGLGQQVHMLQDMSVPAHVRRDLHPFDEGLEKWAGRHINSEQSLINYASANIIKPSMPLTATINKLAPVARLFDTDQYSLTSTVDLSSTALGLAEWTSANFFSDDTINLPGYGLSDISASFPYPNKDSTNVQDVLARQDVPEPIISEDGTPERKVWVKKIADGETIEHLAKVGYTTNELAKITQGSTSTYSRTFILDEDCYADYARKLLPRAVGYSAGLLNYFFRGVLGVTTVPGGLKITNLSTEDMASYEDPSSHATIGAISVYYDDNSNLSQRKLITNASYTLTTPLSPNQPVTISFTPPPDNIKPGKYIVVFHGKLGNEDGAVIGKVVLPPPVYYVARTPEGWKIMKNDADGTNQSVVYNNPDGQVIGKFAVSPDGNTLAFTGSPDGLVVNSAIQLLNLTNPTAPPTVLTNGDWPSWSPDGRKIAFSRDITLNPQYTSDIEIFTIDVATGTTTQLTFGNNGTFYGQPAWSPDGNRIAYTRIGYSNPDCQTFRVIYLMDATGNPIGPAACPPAGEIMTSGDASPAWSPDGREIAFARKKTPSRSYQLHKVNLATRTVTKLTDSPDAGYDEIIPDWSPDGKTIAFGSQKDGDYDVWLVDAVVGGYSVNLTNANTDVDGYPAFGK